MQCADEPQAAAPQRGRPAANRMFFYPRGGPLLASLVPTLAVTAIVAIVLIGHGRFARRHPNPAELRSPDEPTQGISVLGLLCVMLSAAIPLLCFVSVGAQYPALEFADPAAIWGAVQVISSQRSISALDARLSELGEEQKKLKARLEELR